MDIREALLQGATKEKLAEDFMKELDEAAAAIEAEQKKKDLVEEKLDTLIIAMLEYYKAIGMLEDYDEDDIEYAKSAFRRAGELDMKIRKMSTDELNKLLKNLF